MPSKRFSHNKLWPRTRAIQAGQVRFPPDCRNHRSGPPRPHAPPAHFTVRNEHLLQQHFRHWWPSEGPDLAMLLGPWPHDGRKRNAVDSPRTRRVDAICRCEESSAARPRTGLESAPLPTHSSHSYFSPLTTHSCKWLNAVPVTVEIGIKEPNELAPYRLSACDWHSDRSCSRHRVALIDLRPFQHQ